MYTDPLSGLREFTGMQPNLTPSNGPLQADRKPPLKKEDLGPWERIKYWWYLKKAHRDFIRNNRWQKILDKRDERRKRRDAIKALGYNDFHKWENLKRPK